ncbi:MAG: PspC domain-containing protein [Bacteroidales bacterium]|nr:PspC domain-containing protein [Bacteroidales bacterium]
MKKTFPVNINGSIFYIDEDAYQLLNNYLEQLRKTFPGDEGKEITTDIEARIAELFNERIRSGASVIVLADVNSVIETMGRPDDLADEAPADSPAADGSVPPPFNGAQSATPPVKRLYRDDRNKVFGGVISGLGIYMGWNIFVMRLLLVIIACTTYVWPCVFIYLIAWMIIPPARTPRQILEMTGSPVNVSTVGNTVLGTADPGAAYSDLGGGTFSQIMRILGKCIIGFFGIIAACFGIGFLVVFFAAICGLICYAGWGDIALLDQLDIELSGQPVIGTIGMILAACAVIIPCAGLIWGACCALFNTRGAGRTTIITAVVIEIILIITSVVMLHVADVDTIRHTGSVVAVTGLTAFSPLQIC